MYAATAAFEKDVVAAGVVDELPCDAEACGVGVDTGGNGELPEIMLTDKSVLLRSDVVSTIIGNLQQHI